MAIVLVSGGGGATSLREGRPAPAIIFANPAERRALNSIMSGPIFWAIIRRILREMYAPPTLLSHRCISAGS